MTLSGIAMAVEFWGNINILVVMVLLYVLENSLL